MRRRSPAGAPSPRCSGATSRARNCECARRRGRVLVLVAQQGVEIELLGVEIDPQPRRLSAVQARRAARFERPLVRTEPQNEVLRGGGFEVAAQRRGGAPRRRRPGIAGLDRAVRRRGAGIGERDAAVGAWVHRHGAVENQVRAAVARHLQLERQRPVGRRAAGERDRRRAQAWRGDPPRAAEWPGERGGRRVEIESDVERLSGRRRSA